MTPKIESCCVALLSPKIEQTVAHTSHLPCSFWNPLIRLLSRAWQQHVDLFIEYRYLPLTLILYHHTYPRKIERMQCQEYTRDNCDEAEYSCSEGYASIPVSLAQANKAFPERTTSMSQRLLVHFSAVLCHSLKTSARWRQGLDLSEGHSRERGIIQPNLGSSDAFRRSYMISLAADLLLSSRSV